MNFIVTAVEPEKIYPLRQMILHPDQPPEFSIYPSDLLPTTLHLGAFCGEELIGIASVNRERAKEKSMPGSWRLRDLGVIEKFRGSGYGSALLYRCLEYVYQQKGMQLWCYARSSALPFYLKNKFQPVGDYIDLPGFGPRMFLWRDCGLPTSS
jgi:GNAT superfamily N-acetyltransferase